MVLKYNLLGIRHDEQMMMFSKYTVDVVKKFSDSWLCIDNLCDEIVKKDNSHKNTGNTPTSNVTLLSRKITLTEHNSHLFGYFR